MKSFKINIPKGYEIDKEKSTFEEIIFKPIKKELPKSWDDLEEIKGHYINSSCVVVGVKRKINKTMTNFYAYRNVFPTEKEAIASVAIIK